MVMQQAHAQDEITLDQIFGEKIFEAKTVPGFRFMNDGQSFTRLEDNQIRKYDLLTGDQQEVLFDVKNESAIEKIEDYSFSADERKILLRTDSEKIYRHSTRDRFFILANDVVKELYPDAKQSHATFSPDGSQVAFVSENNLFVHDIESGNITQITADGKHNEIINGAGDWVYEEELVLVRAFEWSPDSKRIAFVRFDESDVPEFTLMNYRDGLYPENVTFKYPKVGEQNSKVQVKIYDRDTDQTLQVDIGAEEDIYVPRLKWTSDPGQLCVFRLNRLQNALDLLLADATSGATQILMHENNQYYIDIHDNLAFLKDGKHFIWTSEQDGYNHIYLYDMDGQIARQLTSGAYDVTAFYGYDENRNSIYFQTAERSALQREVKQVSVESGESSVLAGTMGWNSAQFSTTHDYYVLNSSSVNTPPRYSVHRLDGTEVRLLEDNKTLAEKTADQPHNPVEFITVNNAEGLALNGWMIKPVDFDASKEHPLLMFLYGGPGSQMVVDRYEVRFHWWFQMLAQHGYVVACVDNRGTGARGEAFKKSTYLQLGKLETEDQLAAARYFGGLPYIDASRMGIFGWSYGGYMSSLCLFKGDGLLKSAIAVAPVTNWKWYDSIYTERYMRTEATNAQGYQENSPVYFADRLQGNYLLVHGLGDDNVHFQHTAEMAKALIENEKPFDTMFYPNQAHAINIGKARMHLFTELTDFILNKL